MTLRLESDRQCNRKNCNQTLYFDEKKERWVCKAGHVQKAYETRSGVKGI